jgi:hypothetical protein
MPALPPRLGRQLPGDVVALPSIYFCCEFFTTPIIQSPFSETAHETFIGDDISRLHQRNLDRFRNSQGDVDISTPNILHIHLTGVVRTI